ncbi:MAG: sigma-70 family RNA polymerase sigma factor [Methylobacteriaceae bacterium]|nr:sigma-70 family RNA polymerase sigma factor [Methylobacteriaceae bacterium]MBV9222326.1 sigma-70 family RNA polymerase sigma factor [Methylobacteriaceae bacterium]MBV9246867.1 sigma-70 family RNA polymerase sigma factor [Methylobacteriaceae bacterium]MBV9633709.1 sigma-70 family RNA polymerase sigma factor [Methylobacteriaceae bacterium]MBV9701152.1 sigma-70 family RNA polymerase sigma factor [Methylobacteriaceae bacterium]
MPNVEYNVTVLLNKTAENAALVAAVAERRDREAFTQLFDFFAPRINAYLLQLGAERGVAEEITQDVMVTLWHKAELFDPHKSSVGTWLYRIARNRRIDRQRRDRLDFRDPADYALDVADVGGPDADAIIDSGSREASVRLAMQALPEEQLELVRLAFFHGLSHSEISVRTGVPLGTVKSRIRLAFARLRRQLEADGIVEAT